MTDARPRRLKKLKMKRKTETVPFDRDTDDLLSRAMENRRLGYHEDCLKLLRRAETSAVLRPEYLIEASAAASRLGMPEAAGEYLSRAMTAGCRDTAVLYAAAHRLLALGRREEAEGTMYMLSCSILQDEFTARAADELDNGFAVKEPNPPRREYRVSLMLERAEDCFARGEDGRGRECVRRAVAYDKSSPIANAMLALTLADGDRERALKYAKRALTLCSVGDKKAGRILCICAEVFLRCDRKDDARALLKKSDAMKADDYELYIRTLARAGMVETIYRFCSSALGRVGFHRELLHAKSLSAALLGMPKQQAEDGWLRILDAFSSDSCAKDYLRLYREGRLEYREEDFSYGVPPQITEADAELAGQYISGKCGKEARGEAMKTAVRFMNSGEGSREECACIMLMKEKDEGEKLAEQFALRPDFTHRARYEALMELAARGEKPESHELLVLACARSDLTVGMEQTPWVRRIYRNACDYLEELGYNVNEAVLAGTVNVALSDRKLRAGMLSQSTAAEAALVCLYFKQVRAREARAMVLKDYKLRERQLDKLYNPMARLMKEKGGVRNV